MKTHVAFFSMALICTGCAQTPTQPYEIAKTISVPTIANAPQYDGLLESDLHFLSTAQASNRITQNQLQVGQNLLLQFYQCKHALKAYTVNLNAVADRNNWAKSYWDLFGGYVAGAGGLGVTTKSLSVTVGYITTLWGLFGVVYENTWVSARINETQTWQSKLTPIQEALNSADDAFRKMELDTATPITETAFEAWTNQASAAINQSQAFLNLGGLNMAANSIQTPIVSGTH